MIGEGRTRRADGALPYKHSDGREDWLLPGGCAGCGFSIGRFVSASMLLTCPDCQRALCLVCYVGTTDSGFARLNDFPPHTRLVDDEYPGMCGVPQTATHSRLDPARPPCIACAAKRGAA